MILVLETSKLDMTRSAHQTIVESRSWLLFLRGARTGSPRRRLARMPPAKMTSMEDTQRDSGCFLEKGRDPGM